MGLADLKKNVTPCSANFSPQMTVDDFIEAANHYAMGKPQRLSDCEHLGSNQQAMQQLFELQKPAEANEPLNEKPKPFRRSTFTLSEAAIEQLTQLSESSEIAKSKLIRILIKQHFSLSQQEQQYIEQRIKVR
ncbi:CopG family transcriptional regulator [Shewanella donghaensis]|uniref:CopG family transcriptional regulator n=1 Tax=Shewanella donghaensis TaxID=238836 RepID=UPI0011829A78|nr:CopG family transcriptional regulator [Shewanella donghaensis]